MTGNRKITNTTLVVRRIDRSDDITCTNVTHASIFRVLCFHAFRYALQFERKITKIDASAKRIFLDSEIHSLLFSL